MVSGCRWVGSGRMQCSVSTAGGAVAPGSKDSRRKRGRENRGGREKKERRAGKGKPLLPSHPPGHLLGWTWDLATLSCLAQTPWGYTVELYPHCLTVSCYPNSLPRPRPVPHPISLLEPQFMSLLWSLPDPFIPAVV